MVNSLTYLLVESKLACLISSPLLGQNFILFFKIILGANHENLSMIVEHFCFQSWKKDIEGTIC